MIRPPPRATLTDTLFPYTTLFRSTVLTGVYAFGHISGAHFNPAVTLGLWAGDRFPLKDVVPYIVAQVVGAIAAGWILFQIASGQAGFRSGARWLGKGCVSTCRFRLSAYT